MRDVEGEMVVEEVRPARSESCVRERGAELRAWMSRATCLAERAWPEDREKSRQERVRDLLTHLLEEGGELVGASRTFFGRRLRPELVAGNHEHVVEEWGDVAVVLLRLATLLEIDPAKAVAYALDKFERRVEALERSQGAADRDH